MVPSHPHAVATTYIDQEAASCFFRYFFCGAGYRREQRVDWIQQKEEEEEKLEEAEKRVARLCISHIHLKLPYDAGREDRRAGDSGILRRWWKLV